MQMNKRRLSSHIKHLFHACKPKVIHQHFWFPKSIQCDNISTQLNQDYWDKEHRSVTESAMIHFPLFLLIYRGSCL